MREFPFPLFPFSPSLPKHTHPHPQTILPIPNRQTSKPPRSNLLQIKSVFQSIGACLMGIVHGIASVFQAILSGIVSVFDIIIGCLTCRRGGGRRHHAGRSHV